MSDFSFVRRSANGLVRSSSAHTIFSDFKEDKERWLFVAPHDDDLVLGSSFLLSYAVSCGIAVRALITTDGRMGYGSSVSKSEIVEIRAKETKASFSVLGVDDVVWLNYPDCLLHHYCGCKESTTDEPFAYKGQVGLQNSYVAQLRDFRPTRVFIPSGNDYHPDHKTVYNEFLISLFHSTGDIWPQLGEPLAATPDLFEMAIYKDFIVPPDVQLKVSDTIFQKKLDSIAAYVSQKQIWQLIENVKKTGPVEYYYNVTFDLYLPKKYETLFL